MRNEAGLGRQPAAEFSGAAGIDHFLAVKEQQRKGLFGMLDVGQLADRRPRLPSGRDAICARECADRAADGIDEDVTVALAPPIEKYWSQHSSWLNATMIATRQPE